MSLQEFGITHKRLDEALVATVQVNLKGREEVPALLQALRQGFPPESVAGPGFCLIQFVSSVQEGFLAEVGFPVHRPVEGSEVRTWTLPPLEVLSLVHRGPLDRLQESYRKLYGPASERGLVSDEFSREVYLDWDDPEDVTIEVQFVVHDWTGLLGRNLDRVLGEQPAGVVMQGSDALTVESTLDERFCWVKGAMERLEGLADDEQKYKVLSSCAHVFPAGQVDKLRVVYEEARAGTADALAAVDAVITFMEEDPGWIESARREGHVLYSSKRPARARAYAEAKDDRERRMASCYCPLVRRHLEEGMPLTFCYCGAGWFRQQWEGAIGRPVRVEIVRSLLQGDDHCEFAIHLPADL